jgi:ArsR family metal-binding transcriptional regulator
VEIFSRSKMFLDTITLVKTLPCLAEPGKIIVVGRPSQPLVNVIPYLATLPDVIVYNQQLYSHIPPPAWIMTRPDGVHYAS